MISFGALVFDQQFLSLTKSQVSPQKGIGLFTYSVTAAEWMVQFPHSGSWHIEKTTKAHDSSNKNLKNWYCPHLQKACEGQPSKDVEKTLLTQNGSCQYLAIPKEKVKKLHPTPIIISWSNN